MGRDVGRPRTVEVAVDVGVLEEDAGGDLLFEAGAREEVVVDAVDLPRAAARAWCR
jgi:hypothetical protein